MKCWFFCIVFYLLEINSKYTEITWTISMGISTPHKQHAEAGRRALSANQVSFQTSVPSTPSHVTQLPHLSQAMPTISVPH